MPDDISSRALNRKNYYDSVEAAVNFYSRKAVNDTVRARLLQLERDQLNAKLQADKILKELNSEIERQRNAQLLSTQLSLVAGVLYLTQLALQCKAELGADAPASIDGAKSVSDLKAIADGVADSLGKDSRALQINYGKETDALGNTIIEQLKILRKGGYNLNNVPETQVFGPR